MLGKQTKIMAFDEDERTQTGFLITKEKGFKEIDNLLVVIKQEAFHDQDVHVLIRFTHVSCSCEINTMGTGKLHRVLDPAFNRVGHCLHVQSCDHCGAKTQKQQNSAI